MDWVLDGGNLAWRVGGEGEGEGDLVLQDPFDEK